MVGRHTLCLRLLRCLLLRRPHALRVTRFIHMQNDPQGRPVGSQKTGPFMVPVFELQC
jgi:hypothetical protein